MIIPPMSPPAWPSASKIEDSFWDAAITAVAAALPDFLLRQRWYPAKHDERPAVQIAELVPISCGHLPAAIAVWQVKPAKSSPLFMLVPLVVMPASAADPKQVIACFDRDNISAAVVEAFSQQDFVRRWVDIQLRSEVANNRSGRFHAVRTSHQIKLDPANAIIRRSSAEQSNTSFLIGDRAILKVIRKIEAGTHPEIEIARFLGAANFAATPALLGWTELAGSNLGDHGALSLLQEFVTNEGDGWSWTLTRLVPIALGEDAACDQLSSWLRMLSIRTAELHRVFAQDSMDMAFCPEPACEADLKEWALAAQQMAECAIDALKAQTRLSETERQLAAGLIDGRDVLLQQTGRLAQFKGSFVKTRHHGDYHLGQVLVAGSDAIILDFEGEPLRPLSERRAKHCVLRDVAGILRSLAYAQETAHRSMSARNPGAGQGKAAAVLRAWCANASRQFVDDYFDAAAGLASIPANRGEVQQLLDFFVLEKALYEIRYELANRPDWVSIPLQGVVSLLASETDGARPRHATPSPESGRPQ